MRSPACAIGCAQRTDSVNSVGALHMTSPATASRVSPAEVLEEPRPPVAATAIDVISVIRRIKDGAEQLLVELRSRERQPDGAGIGNTQSRTAVGDAVEDSVRRDSSHESESAGLGVAVLVLRTTYAITAAATRPSARPSATSCRPRVPRAVLSRVPRCPAGDERGDCERVETVEDVAPQAEQHPRARRSAGTRRRALPRARPSAGRRCRARACVRAQPDVQRLGACSSTTSLMLSHPVV